MRSCASFTQFQSYLNSESNFYAFDSVHQSKAQFLVENI